MARVMIEQRAMRPKSTGWKMRIERSETWRGRHSDELRRRGVWSTSPLTIVVERGREVGERAGERKEERLSQF